MVQLKMIKLLREKIELHNFFVNEIKENGAFIEIDNSFYDENHNLNNEEILNIAIDNYYNSLSLRDTPPSIDNLVIIERSTKKYSLYLIELKYISKLSRLNLDNIKNKFKTVLNDFMLNKFHDEFNHQDVCIIDFQCWLVSNRFNFMSSEISDEEYSRRIRNTLIEKLLLIRPFRFRGKIALIQSIASGELIV